MKMLKFLKKNKTQSQLLQNQKNAVDRIFSTPDGKLFLSWIGNAAFGGVGKINSSSDSYWRGRESLLLDILTLIKIQPHEYYRMISEMMEEGGNNDIN
jgi:hypothetical protein